MKRPDAIREGHASIIRSAAFLSVALLALGTPAGAAQFHDARVTQIIKDVRLLGGRAAARPAAVNDEVSAGTAVRTGSESRTELTFPDLTITRLGANTIFSFNEGSRELGLTGGAMLVEIPPSGAEVKIVTSAVSAGITGGTALFEANKGLPTKLLVMEGLGRFWPTGHPEQAVIVHAGEMVMMTVGGRITAAAKFNAALVFQTAKLFTSFPPLPNEELILAVIAQQQATLNGPSASPPSGGSGIDTRDQAASARAQPAATGSSKYGSPSTITFPNPYQITNGTLISTDPMITTNGVTNSGKIYRDITQDGSFLTWLGVPTTAFDIASKEPQPDQEGAPLPTFVFSGLQINGDPMISTANGGVPHLGLVSQGGITFSSVGNTFHFSGLDVVGILALNGSIDTVGASFANFGNLFMEARGASSDLTFSGPADVPKVDLVAERTLEVSAPITASNHFKAFAGQSFQTASAINAQSINIQSLGSFTVTNSAQLLSLLGPAGGGHGQILIAASGNDTTSNVGGVVQADQGEVDIRTTGVNGQVTVNAATLRGDIVKVSALGTNGVLNIGVGNTLNADTVLKLYAPGSNGTLNFKSNVTLSSPSTILAANTINIDPSVVVTINSVNMADVYTNHPNYSGWGGNGPPGAAGTFGGAGARNPQPLSNAPPLGGPGGGP